MSAPCVWELSQLCLSEPAVPLHELAFLLGYSEPSAFHRAFRRWTGRHPTGVSPPRLRRGRLDATGLYAARRRALRALTQAKAVVVSLTMRQSPTGVPMPALTT